MKVVTLNVNGLRSSQKKGLYQWLEEESADFVCLQEVRLNNRVNQKEVELAGYTCHFSVAEKNGYSGVAIFSKAAPLKVITSFDFDFLNGEARYLEYVFESFRIASIYMPSGSSSELAQEKKMCFLSFFKKQAESVRRENLPILYCGDFNMAHKAVDIKNWRANQKKPGFTLEERAWLDSFFDDLRFVDVFRLLNSSSDQFTWWSNRANAYQNNVGWRIDYQAASPDFPAKPREVSIYKGRRFSDHAPLIVTYASS